MSTFLYDDISSKFPEIFANKSNVRKLERHISNYIDKNADVLNDPLPSKRLFFGRDTEDMKVIYKIIDTTPKEVEKTLKKIKSIDPTWKTLNEESIITLALLHRYFSSINDEKMTKLTLKFMTLRIYSTLHYKFYPHLPNENIMKYTMNRINNRFYFKAYGSVIAAISAVADQKYNSSKIDNKDDDDIIQYTMSLYSRINNQMRSFAEEFYIDQKNKNYLNSVEDKNDEENFFEVESLSGNIKNYYNKSVDSFFRSNINRKIAGMAASMSSLPSSTVYQIMNDIRTNENYNISKLVNNILAVYVSDKNNSINSIGSKKFISYSTKVYTKSNTKDPLIIETKKILDNLLKEYSIKYNQTDRLATKNNYRKAIYLYMVLHIASET